MSDPRRLGEGGQSVAEEQLLRLFVEASQGQPIFGSIDDVTDKDKIQQAVRRAVERIKPKAAELWRSLTDSGSEFVSTITHIAREEHADLYEVLVEWLVQRMLFLEIGKHFELQKVSKFSGTRPEAALVLTRKGSFVIAGKRDPTNGLRDVEYIRIDSRMPSWNDSTAMRTEMGDASVGESLGFTDFITTSSLQCILVIPLALTEKVVQIRAAVVEAVTHVTRITRTPSSRS